MAREMSVNGCVCRIMGKLKVTSSEEGDSCDVIRLHGEKLRRKRAHLVVFLECHRPVHDADKDERVHDGILCGGGIRREDARVGSPVVQICEQNDKRVSRRLRQGLTSSVPRIIERVLHTLYDRPRDRVRCIRWHALGEIGLINPVGSALVPVQSLFPGSSA